MDRFPKVACIVGILLGTAVSSQAFAREYDPRIGRFIQTDPVIGNRPSMHYLYAGNNPVSFTDPTGETISIPKSMEGQFDALLKAKGLGGFTKTVLDSGFITYRGDADSMTHPAAHTLDSEIFFRMIMSERWFSFDSMARVQAEVSLRTNIVAAANSANWTFKETNGRGPQGYKWNNGTFAGDPSTLVGEWFSKDATKYETDCSVATLLIMLQGLKDTINYKNDKGDIVDKFNVTFAGMAGEKSARYSLVDMVQKIKQVNTSGDAMGSTITVKSKYDWVPGDASHIAPAAGPGGYNIIYLGGSYDTGEALLRREKAFFGGFCRVPSSFQDYNRGAGFGATLSPTRLTIDLGKVAK